MFSMKQLLTNFLSKKVLLKYAVWLPGKDVLGLLSGNLDLRPSKAYLLAEILHFEVLKLNISHLVKW